MITAAATAATKTCSALQYLVDRGEIENITEVLTHVRYTSDTVVAFQVVCDGRVIQFDATDVGEAESEDEDA